MKKIITIVIVFCMIISFNVFADTNKEEMRGVWVASVLNLDYPSEQTTNFSLLKADVDKILNQAEKLGFNAIFIQVRPTSDALYKSNIFPWSIYLTGKQGLAPDDGFDPLSYWVEAAHARGMELHAWINPYRISKRRYNEPIVTVESLAENNPARLHPEWVIAHSDGNLYYDPALAEVRELITDGVMEIVKNYNVDGIHFDDYFYPAVNFADEQSYQRYGKGMELADWRRNNVNKLIKKVSRNIKDYDENIDFGISPFGIWANKSSHEKGSNTAGKQSYYEQYVDSVYWIEEELIDYIVPQLYWHIGFEIADYKELLYWWQKQVKHSKTKLYIGQATYRVTDDKESIWYAGDEIIRQLQLNQASKHVDGSIFFRIGSFNNQNLKQKIIDFYHGDLKVELKEESELNEESESKIEESESNIEKETSLEVKEAETTVIDSQEQIEEQVEPSNWARRDVFKLLNTNLLDDRMAGAYQEPVTRLDFAYLGVRLYEIIVGEEVELVNKPFTDCKDDYVLKARNIGIISGYPDGSFKPDKAISRQELALVFVKTLNKVGIDTIVDNFEPFADDDKIDDWSKSAVYSARELGIIKGELYNKFNPNGTATREQALVMLKRVIDKDLK